jgi:hypothetical protein
VLIRWVAVALSVAVVAASCGSTSAVPLAPTNSAPRVSDADWVPGVEQTSEAAAVTVVASWLATGATAARVTMDTHSVDLDGFDLRTLARVRLDGGTWVTPSAWDAPKGEHHREGTLAFTSVDRSSLDAAGIVELEIRDVAVPSRILRWERPR